MFSKLKQTFIKALILYCFNLEYYIKNKTNISSNTIGEVLSQLTSNNSSQRYPIALYFQKIILIKTQKIYNNKILIIVEIFKTCQNYLKSCKYEIFIFINYKNFYCFIYTKNLGSK